MAKGRCAAQSANRRANEAQEQVRAGVEELNAERLRRRQEGDALRSEIKALRLQLVQEVNLIAARKVAEANARADRRIEAETDALKGKAVDALDYLVNNREWPAPMSVAVQLATALGIKELFTGMGKNASPGAGRVERRLIKHKIKAITAGGGSFIGEPKQEATSGAEVVGIQKYRQGTPTARSDEG